MSTNNSEFDHSSGALVDVYSGCKWQLVTTDHFRPGTGPDFVPIAVGLSGVMEALSGCLEPLDERQ